MVNIQEYREKTIQYLDDTLESIWLKSGNLTSENQDWEERINKDGSDEQEVDFIRAQVIKNIIGKINKENSESEKIVIYSLGKKIFEEISDSFLEIVGDYDVFSTNIKKVIKYIKTTEGEEEFRKLWEKYFNNFLDRHSEFDSEIFLINEYKWKVVKKMSKESIEKLLEELFLIYKQSNSNVSLSSHLELLKESYRDYEGKIDEASNSKDIKEVFQNILNDRTLLDKMKDIAIWFGEDTFKGINERVPDVTITSSNFDGRLKNYQEEINKRVEPIIRDYQKEVRRKNSIIDIINLTNEKGACLSVEFMKKVMLCNNEVTNTHLKYIKEENWEIIFNSSNKFLLISWLSCEKGCYNENKNNKWIDFSLWEDHLQDHTNSFYESFFDTRALMRIVEWVGQNKEKILENAKERVIKEAEEKKLTIENLEELLEKMTIIEQVDNFRKWKIDKTELETKNLKSQQSTTSSLTNEKEEITRLKKELEDAKKEAKENSERLTDYLAKVKTMSEEEKREKEQLKNFLTDYVSLLQKEEQPQYEAQIVQEFLPKIDNWK